MPRYGRQWVAKKEFQKKDPDGRHQENTGPCYDPKTLLKVLELLRDALGPAGLGYATQPREPEPDDGTLAEQRSALRQAVKSEKRARRAAQQSADMVEEVSQMAMRTLCPLWGTKATVKLKNVPPTYSQETLTTLLAWRFQGTLDFLYLPNSPEGSPPGIRNLGHAFLNFRLYEAADNCIAIFNGVKSDTCFPGTKLADQTSDETCWAAKADVASLDKIVAELREQARAGQPTQLPVLLDWAGFARPLPTGALSRDAPEFISVNATAIALKQQIEYYFSFENMCRDVYLRSQMDDEGWVAIYLLASFPKVMQHGESADRICTYLMDSDILEVDAEGLRVRLKDSEQRVLWELRGALDGKTSTTPPTPS